MNGIAAFVWTLPARWSLATLIAGLAAWACLPSRADWFQADLPFNDYLSQPITGIACPGASDVWAVTTYSYQYQDKEHVRWNSNAYHSRNDGLLWDLPFDAPSSQTDPTPNKYPFQDTQLYAVAFADRDNGWLFGWQKPTFGLKDPPGAYVFYHTTDRGRTWTISTVPNTAPKTPGEPDFAIDAIDTTHAVAVQGAHVFETADGVNWRERAGVYPRLFSVQALGLKAPRAAGTDGGKAVGGSLSPSAFTQDVTAPGVFHATRFADANTGWVAGGDPRVGTIMGTSTAGTAWKTQLSAPSTLFRGLAATSATQAWAAGQTTGQTPAGVVYHTTDGSTWTFDAGLPGRLFCVAFRDRVHGWVAGDAGLFRYVPGVQSATGDLDRNGETDVQDTVALLRRAAGFDMASPSDPARMPVSIAEAVASARAQANRPQDPRLNIPADTVIVFNTLSADTDGDGVGDSLQVAQHYARARGIPAQNLVPITWHDAEAFQDHPAADGGGRANWTDAYNTVVTPLKDMITARGRDNIYIVLFCTGVPYRFNVTAPDGSWDSVPLDTSLNDLFRTDAENWSSASPYFAPLTGATQRYGRARFQYAARPLGQPVIGPTGGPIRDPFYLVSRIDGPSLDACLAMIDNAIFAEQHRGPGGYDGVAYIDTRAEAFHGAPYSLDELRAWTPWFYDYAGIDESIARAILTFADRGLPWKDEVTNDSIGTPPDAAGPRWRDGSPATTAPRAMFYAGWYNYAAYYDAWDWLPGSVGIDYDSASAYGFRGVPGFFAPGALSHGLTALVGVIGEPFNYHPKPDALFEYLARGFTFAEAAMLSTETPRTAKAIFLGDPKYRPFAALAGTALPDPKPVVSSVRTATGWSVTVTTSAPVNVALRSSTDGSDPTSGGTSVPAQPAFYAFKHTFRVSAPGSLRIALTVTDVLGASTTTASTVQ